MYANPKNPIATIGGTSTLAVTGMGNMTIPMIVAGLCLTIGLALYIRERIIHRTTQNT